MWDRTRDSRVRGPNEKILGLDAKRLKQPVPSGWQLCYLVENFAPAAQLVAVEQQGEDGTWKSIQSCHTIEFQSRAAQPRGGLTRAHAAPVQWDGNAEELPKLRFALRGVGAVRLHDVTLSNGSASWPGRLTRSVLGCAAPRSGFPRIDWNVNQDELPVSFGPPGGAQKRPWKRGPWRHLPSRTR